MLGKIIKVSFTSHSERASDLLGLVHSGVGGQLNKPTRGGFPYFIIFTENFSRYGFVYQVRHKSNFFEKFKKFKDEL